MDRLLYRAVAELAPAQGLEAQLPIFQAMYLARLNEFHRANETRDPEQGRQFWIRLAGDWLSRCGQDPSLAERLQRRVDELAFGHPSAMFRLYDDSVSCLRSLHDRGIKMAIISNWDYTLHPVARMFGLDEFAPVVLASLEEGMEKPDPRLFEIALERLGARPEETVHVGDDPLDDVQGALGVGMRPVLIDRSGATGDAIRSLTELEKVLWND